jgi:hypothetical protein
MIASLPASVDAGQVLAAGATAIRDMFPADMVPGILDAYQQGLRVAFAIGIGGVAMAAVTAPLGRWTKLDMSKAAGGGGA